MIYCICSPLDTFEFGFVSGVLTLSVLLIIVLLFVKAVTKRD